MQVDSDNRQRFEDIRDSDNYENYSSSNHKSDSDCILHHTKFTSIAHTDSHINMMTKMMQNRCQQSDYLSKWDKIYCCSGCNRQFKLYDPYNDDPYKLYEDENVELVDEITFRNDYICSQWDLIAWPSCIFKKITDSQSTCYNCSEMSSC